MRHARSSITAVEICFLIDLYTVVQLQKSAWFCRNHVVHIEFSWAASLGGGEYLGLWGGRNA